MPATPPSRISLHASLVMGSLALILIGGGVYAFVSAPAEANRATALIIPGVSAALVLLVAGLIFLMRASRSPLPMIAGVVLCFLLAAAFLMPWRARSAAAERYPQALQEWNAALASGQVQDNPEVKDAFFRERRSPDHDIKYLTTTLFFLMAASAATGITVLQLTVGRRRLLRGTT